MLHYSLTLRVPAWASPPTVAAFGELYRSLQAQLDLDSLQTPGSPPDCHMGRGQALQIKVLPAQGLFHCARDLQAADGAAQPQTVETVTQQFLAALSETMSALRPILLASPAAQLRALWPVTQETAAEMLTRLGAAQLHPERLRPGLLVGYHLLQDPRGSLPQGEIGGVADVRIEPFVRAPSRLWVETSFALPAVAIPGAGVRIDEGSAPPGHGAKSVRECGMKAKELLDQLPSLFER